jgi:DNA-directed RNA polymerase specialized sigma subunit
MQRKESEAKIGIQSPKAHEIKVQSQIQSDEKLVEYVYRVLKIDAQIKQKENKIRFLKAKLIKMESFLRKTKGLKQKIFVMRYIDSLSIRKIAWNLNYSERRIQQILSKISRELEISESEY